METFGARLAYAIEHWTEGDRSIQALAERLQEAGVRGGSRRMIQDYLRDRREPSYDFVRGAARVLDVDPLWLEVGRGEVIRSPAGIRDTPDPRQWPSTEVLTKALVRVGWELTWETYEIAAMFAQLVAEVAWSVNTTPDRNGEDLSYAARDLPHEEWIAIAEDLAYYIALPLGSPGFLKPENTRRMRNYLVTSISALMQIALDNGEGGMIEDMSSSPLRGIRA